MLMDAVKAVTGRVVYLSRWEFKMIAGSERIWIAGWLRHDRHRLGAYGHGLGD
jgi:hypothetical protein